VQQFSKNNKNGDLFQSFFNNNKFLSSEMISLSPDNIKESILTAQNNSLTQINATKCEQELKKYYNIPDNISLILKKSDFPKEFNAAATNSDNTTELGQSLSYSLYNPITGEKLDTSKCSGIQIKMPLNARSRFNLNIEPYKYLIHNRSVDVFNFTDPFYTSRCFVYQQNGVDIPLNSRRHLLFPNTTVSCGTGCTYSGIDNETNMVCECKEQNKCSSGDFLQDFKKELLETIESSNILILECNVSTIII